MMIVLPLPPSANRLWRSLVVRGRTRVLLSAEGRQFKRQVDLLVRAQRAPYLTGDVRITMVVYFCNRKRDLDNAVKAVLDALGGGLAYRDDRQVAEMHIRREFDKSSPRVEITIERIA